jgi:GYF domain 2
MGRSAKFFDFEGRVCYGCVVNWYYAVGDQINGPVSRVELESLFSAGTLSQDTLVLQEGMYDWIHFVDLKKTTQILPVVGTTPEKPLE